MAIAGNVFVLPANGGSAQRQVCASVIGFKSVLPISTVSGAAADANYPFNNCLDYQDNTKYSPSASSGSVVITFQQSGTSQVNYLGIGVHNGFTAGLSGKLEAYVGGSWVEVCTFAAYGDNKTIMKYFDAVTVSQQRLTLNFTSKLYLGYIYIGNAWLMMRKPDIGFQPAHLNNVDEVTMFRSDNGQFIRGRRISKGYETSAKFSFLKFSDDDYSIENWYRDYQEHVKNCRPIFFKWDLNADQNAMGLQDPNSMQKMVYDSSLYGTLQFTLLGRD